MYWPLIFDHKHPNKLLIIVIGALYYIYYLLKFELHSNIEINAGFIKIKLNVIYNLKGFGKCKILTYENTFYFN